MCGLVAQLSGDRSRKTLNYNSHIVFIKLKFSTILFIAKNKKLCITQLTGGFPEFQNVFQICFSESCSFFGQRISLTKLFTKFCWILFYEFAKLVFLFAQHKCEFKNKFTSLWWYFQGWVRRIWKRAINRE